MSDSILTTIKKMLGLDSADTAFDTDIIVMINSTLMILHQYGVGPKEGFSITGSDQVWSDLLPSDKLVEGVKTYIFLKVKMSFDPPTSSYVLNAYKEQAAELEYRIKEQLENYPGNIEDDADIQEEPDDTYDIDHKYYDPWAEGDL